jgi:hypothetical protein
MSTRPHPCSALLFTLTLLYYGGGLPFAYASPSVVAETGSIQGEVVDSVTGAPVARARVGVMPIHHHDGQPLEATTDADGKFVFARVLAGEYAWWVRKSGHLSAPSSGRPATLRGVANNRIVVPAEQPLHLRVPLAPASGRLVFEGRQQMSLEMSMSVHAGLAPANGDGCHEREQAGLPVEPDGTFEILASPGACIPTVTPPPGWYVKAIQLGGADVTGRIVTVEQGQSPGEMRVILTERRNEVSFAVVDARGAATREYVAIVFPVDESLWPAKQTVRLHVPRGDGTSITDEPHAIPRGPHSDYSAPLGGIVPGEYYAVAVDDMAWEDLAEPALLRRLSEKAIKFQIGEGETRRVDLKRVDLAGF